MHVLQRFTERPRSLRPIGAMTALVLGLSPFYLGAQDVFRLKIDAPTEELTASTEFDAALLFDTNSAGVQGWSLGVAHNGEELEMLEVKEGPAVDPAKNGGFFSLDDTPVNGSGFTIAVVLSFTQPTFLPPDNDQVLATMRYRVLVNPIALAEPCESVVTTIALSGELKPLESTPPVNVRVTVDGQSKTTEIVNADITVRCPGTIEFSRCEADTENVFMEWQFGGPPEWEFLFLYRDGDFIASLDIDQMGYTDEAVEPGDHQYTLVTVVVNDAANPLLLFAQCETTVIPLLVDGIDPPVGDWIGGETVTLTGRAFELSPLTSLEFVAPGEDPLPLEMIEVTSDATLTAITPQAPRLGTYTVRIANERGNIGDFVDGFAYGFTRGEVNDMAPLDIADAIAFLEFLFYGSRERPRCEDSADANDDGLLDVSDAILVLGFLFFGDIPPRAPFPQAGEDPTTDMLGCLD